MNLRPISIILCAALLVSCDAKKASTPEEAPPTDQLILPPPEIEIAIRKEFPGAVPTNVFADTLYQYLNQHYHITAKDILLGISTCVDDIIYTKNFHRHTEIKGPFHMGGLGGLPFSGVSGLNAFAHHVPADGTMVLLMGPHIGYSSKGGWGYVLRPGQAEASSCCGALSGTLSSLEKGTIKQSPLDEDDYQGWKIGQFALSHEGEILAAPNHLIKLTQLTSLEAEAQIMRFMPKIDLEHEHFVVAIGMVLINTDYPYYDYVAVTHYKVYDLKNRVFLENK